MAPHPLPGVPCLSGKDNVDDWLLAIKGYLGIHKGLRNFLGHSPEPWRKVDARDPEKDDARDPKGDDHTGLTPPDATTSMTGCTLSTSQLNRWETWSEHELFARGAILLSVEPWIAKRLDKLWSASLMREAILKEYKEINPIEARTYAEMVTLEIRSLVLPVQPFNK